MSIFGCFSWCRDFILLFKVSTPLPLLRLLGLPTIFYCHYPDLLLSTDRTSLLKRLYRIPLDWLEQWSTGLADILLVNSNFTKEVFKDTFPRLNRIQPAVLYPSLATAIFQVVNCRWGEFGNSCQLYRRKAADLQNFLLGM